MRILLVLVLLLTVGIVCASFAATTGDMAVGEPELNLLNSLFSGYLGFALGLVIVAVGIYIFAMGNTTGGITMLILGVLITLIPGVYNAATNLFVPMVCNLWSLGC